MASGQLIQTQVDIEEVEKALAGTSKSLKAIRKSVLRIAAKKTTKRVKAAINASDLHRRTGELAKAYVELKEYFDSNRAGFDIHVVFNTGTPFQKKVWNALNSIPYGGTASYEDIALKLTDSNLSEARKITRAVGSACSDNPVAVIVPCHRVIGKDGSIVGYSAGIDIKDYLLLHESFTAVTPLISKEV